MKELVLGICYDFDKTLSPKDMQEFHYIESLGYKNPVDFWIECDEIAKTNNCDGILAYMYLMAKKNPNLTRKQLIEEGKYIKLYKGVDTWFKRINNFGKKLGVKVEHYIISSGTKEILEGSSIAKNFKEIFGCEFYYDPVTKEPVWPKLAINYTQKTQYIYRIRKNAVDLNDDITINTKSDNIRIPYTHMVYLGDGMTDIPCMQLIQNNHGHSIALYKDRDEEALKKLLKERRTNVYLKADYSEGSELEKVIQSIIQSVANETLLESKTKKLADKLGIKWKK